MEILGDRPDMALVGSIFVVPFRHRQSEHAVQNFGRVHFREMFFQIAIGRVRPGGAVAGGVNHLQFTAWSGVPDPDVAVVQDDEAATNYTKSINLKIAVPAQRKFLPGPNFESHRPFGADGSELRCVGGAAGGPSIESKKRASAAVHAEKSALASTRIRSSEAIKWPVVQTEVDQIRSYLCRHPCVQCLGALVDADRAIDIQRCTRGSNRA